MTNNKMDMHIDIDEKGHQTLVESSNKVQLVADFLDTIPVVENGHALYKSFILDSEKCAKIGNKNGIDRYVFSDGNTATLVAIDGCMASVIAVNNTPK